MAEAKEVRHAGIGLDLSINGLDDFKRANSMTDDFLETMKEASRITDKFKNNFSDFGGKSIDEVRKTRDAIQDVYHSMDSAKNETNQVTENVHKMQQEFKYTSDAAKKIKINSGLNDEAKKVLIQFIKSKMSCVIYQLKKLRILKLILITQTNLPAMVQN